MDYDNFDIFKLIENAIEEQNVTNDFVVSIKDTVEKIKKGGFVAPKKSKKQKTLNQEEENLKPEEDSSEDENADEELIFKSDEVEEKENSITLDDSRDFNKFRDALNRFRAAGSLKDSEVEENLKEYFKNMTSGERQAIYVTIKGLTQVADLVMSGEDAFRPSNNGIKITASSSSDNKKIEISSEENEEKKEKKYTKDKAVVNTKTRKIFKKDKKEKYSTNPIQVESKIQNKTNILSVLRENFDKV